MIKYELLFLGLLKERPRYGYEIKKEIKKILSVMAGVELKSIYYPLRKLEKENLVVKVQQKKGRRPLRYVYSLTPLGAQRFEEILKKSLVKLERPQFIFNLSLYFLKYLKPSVAYRGLRVRSIMLRKLIKAMKKTISLLREAKDSRLISILKHDQEMAEAELDFLNKFLEEIYKC